MRPKSSNRPDAVAFTVDTFCARRAVMLAEKWRKAGIPVISGGFHPTLAPEECMAYSDAVVIGDAEDTWPEVLADLKAGALKPVYRSAGANLPVRQDMSVFHGMHHLPVGLVQFSRGCRNHCDFCSIRAFYGDHVRTRAIDEVVAEIRDTAEWKGKLLFFVDDNLFVDRERTRALFKALIPLKRRWACQISMDVAEDPELLHLMKRSGCFMTVIGFESLNADNLKQMQKGVNLRAGEETHAGQEANAIQKANAVQNAHAIQNATMDESGQEKNSGICSAVDLHRYDRVISNLHAHGIMIYGTFVFGYDHDTPQTIAETVDFAIRNGFAIANFNPLMPMPGTPLLERLRKEGRLIHDKWWLDPAYRYGDATLKPVGMTPEELTAGCRDARFRFNTAGNILRRLWNGRKANSACPGKLVIYLLSNGISRREIHAKQGRSLGERMA